MNPRTGEPYHRDPRGVAERAEAYLQSTGVADTAFFASEAEFFVFEDVRYQVEPNSVFYKSIPMKHIGTPAARKKAAILVIRPLSRAVISRLPCR